MQTIKAIVANVFVYSSGHYLVAKTKSENRPWAAAAAAELSQSRVLSSLVVYVQAQARTNTSTSWNRNRNRHRWQPAGGGARRRCHCRRHRCRLLRVVFVVATSLCFCLAYKTRGVPLPLCKRAGRQLNRSCSSSSIESCCIAIGFTLVNSFSDLVIPHSASQLGGGGNVEAGRAQTCLPHHHQQLDHPTQQYQ